jgi:hypothetical protein
MVVSMDVIVLAMVYLLILQIVVLFLLTLLGRGRYGAGETIPWGAISGRHLSASPKTFLSVTYYL